MPAGDQTGPMGFGPMTGRGAGYCAGFPVPGYMNPLPGLGMGRGRGFGWGRGFGRGRGLGRGRRFGYYAMGWPGWAAYGGPAYGPSAPNVGPYNIPSEQETEMLKAQAEHLEQALTDIKKRLDELEAAEAKKE